MLLPSLSRLSSRKEVSLCTRLTVSGSLNRCMSYWSGLKQLELGLTSEFSVGIPGSRLM